MIFKLGALTVDEYIFLPVFNASFLNNMLLLT
jgi:hypothetical protein